MGEMAYDLGAEQVFQRTIKIQGTKFYVVGISSLTHFYSSCFYSSSVSLDKVLDSQSRDPMFKTTG